ncbi:MAG TPA: GNAT family N-acetyltransferase [Streptosporangiaceae bacterium]|nr:GNAT family N-acetyltransferase [Streptosporangiaceae bacterium]
MDVSYPIRPVDDAELPAFGQVADHAFNSNVPPAKMLEFDRLVIEPERTLVAFDGDRAVGTTLAFSFGLTVPGGDIVGAAGISGVGVLPTHRRRGVLSSLMRRQLADIAAGSEPVAALFASESAIYGRYGYGSAADQYSFTFNRGDGRLRPLSDVASNPASTPAPMLRLAEPKSAAAEMKAVYEAVRPTRPGMLTRHDGWWDGSVSDPEFLREGNSPLRCVIAEDQAGPRGYALYAAKPDWGRDGMPAQVLSVRELFWTDPASAVALWADLLSRDLVIEVRTRMRPADDPIQHLLADPRRTRTRVSDGLWIRIVSLPEALMRRRYSCPVDTVIEVADPQLTANEGRWRLTAGGRADGENPSCERTTASADVTLPMSALGAAYLGGARLGGLAAAGQITEHRPGALTELSAAMWWDPAPWSPMMF